MQSSTVASFGMLMVLEIAPEMKGCAAAIMRMWLSTDEIALADLAAGVGAVEHRIVLGLQVRRAFERHRAADVDVGGLDLALGEADGLEQVEAGGCDLPRHRCRAVADEVFAEGPLVEDELDVEGGRKRLLDLGDGFVGKALGLQRRGVDARRVGERAVADGVGLDLRDLGSRDSRARAAPRGPRG